MALSPRVKTLLHERGIAGYEDISGEDTAPQRQISSNVQGMLEKRKKQIAGYDKVKTKKINGNIPSMGMMRRHCTEAI